MRTGKKYGCRLQHLFVGLKEVDLVAVKQFKLKALALQLVYIVRASNSSALAVCEHFLEQVEDTQRFVLFVQFENDWSKLGFCLITVQFRQVCRSY